MKIFGKKDKVKTPEKSASRIYDYSTPESRVATANWLFEQAKNERTQKETEWIRNHEYYSFKRETSASISEALEELGLPVQPVVPDPYIMVESQLTPEVPQPEFHGRDSLGDGETAAQRQFAVRYIIEANRLDDLNTSNERRLWKLGDAFWKAYYDETMPFGERDGNIRVRDVSPEDIYPDPSAGASDLDGCEYVDYVYTMHKLAFWRVWHRELEKLGLSPDEIVQASYREQDGLLEPTVSTSAVEDRVQILEHWFRQPYDTKDADAGDIACSIQAGGYELKYIPKYWQATGRQCKLFPFVHYWIIRDETQFWNRSELDSIVDMVDAADRELAVGLLNDAMMANDVVLIEDGALKPGEVFTNRPGATVRVNQGRMNGVARLGGLHDGVNSLGMVNWLQEQMQRTNRNYDTNNGKETARVTTSSGLLQLRGDAEAQQKLKKADRDAGFCRLYELLDWLALEFFDDDRMLVIGAKDKDDEPESLQYNGRNFARMLQPAVDPLTGAPIGEPVAYYPRIDVTVTTGAGLSKNPATTVEVLDKLAGAAVTEDNWRLLAAELDYLDIPQKQEIIDRWRDKFQPAVPPEVLQALANDPQLLEAVTQAVQLNGAAPGGMEIPQGMPPQTVQPTAPAGLADAENPNRALLIGGGE
ncbi:MAG: hypothetical protein IJT18_08085 [Oscillospiraceae bacterium]|nr:hypothetical protein [Oscillospiraceae bacterium]